MGLRHRCTFCEWERGAGPATLLDPLCERCGCVMDAVAPTAADAPRTAVMDARGLALAQRVGVVVLALGIVPLVTAAAKLGYGHGGLPLAAGATAVAALLLYVFLAPAPR